MITAAAVSKVFSVADVVESSRRNDDRFVNTFWETARRDLQDTLHLVITRAGQSSLIRRQSQTEIQNEKWSQFFYV